MCDQRIKTCPGCGQPVRPDEDYVVALEHDAESEFTLHQKRRDGSTQRRFHVEHFRGRLGGRVFTLVQVQDT